MIMVTFMVVFKDYVIRKRMKPTAHSNNIATSTRRVWHNIFLLQQGLWFNKLYRVFDSTVKLVLTCIHQVTTLTNFDNHSPLFMTYNFTNHLNI